MTTTTTPTITASEIMMLISAARYFETNYEPPDEADTEGVKHHEADLNTLWSAIDKLKSH